MAGVDTKVASSPLSHAEEHAEIRLQAEEWFDLQPIEKKLITYSFSLGIFLLILFIFVFEVFQ